MSRRDEGLAAWFDLVQASSVVGEVLERELEDERGLALGSLEVLVHLDAAPEGRLRMQDLARSVVLSKSGITRLVDRLEDAGLVGRAPCETDRRAVYAGITPSGREALGAAIPDHRRGVEEHFARHLTREETRALRTILAKVLRAHGRSEPPCPRAPQAARA